MPTIEELTTEVETLRRVNADLLSKKARSKDKIASLEADKIALQSQVTASEERIKTVALERPVARLMKEISHVPEVLADHLAKSYRFESDDQGELLLMNVDGTPAIKDADGKPLPIDGDTLAEFLAPKDSEDASAKVYRHLLTGSKANGGGATGTGKGFLQVESPQQQEQPSKPPSPFGLR